MGLIADLQRRNHELEERVSHLEAAFEGLRQLAAELLRENESGRFPIQEAGGLHGGRMAARSDAPDDSGPLR